MGLWLVPCADREGVQLMRYSTKADCVVCGADLDHKYDGRERHYCSSRCRKKAQRIRENAEQVARELAAKQELKRRYAKFSVDVAEKLASIELVYGVWAAYEASEVVYLAILEQNVTSDPSQIRSRSGGER